MNLMRLLLPIVSILLVFSSCKRSPTQPPNSGLIADFPNQVGNRWTYSFYDSVSQQSDTVTVMIVAQTTIPPDKPATIWRKIFTSHIDTVFVTVLSDTVRIIPKENISAQWVNTKYIFPLHVGQSWRGDFVSDTSTVVENRPYAVVAGTFVIAFRIEERWGAVNDYGAVSTWYVPKVGVIKIHRRTWGFGGSNELWELMSYHVSP